MVTVFLMNLLLMGLWVVSTGALTFGNALLGFAIGFIVLWWLKPLAGDTGYFRKLPLTFWFALLFMWEVIKSNLRVAWDVVSLMRRRQPGIVAIPLDAETEWEITILANMITLTPGSLCLDLSEDRRTMYVHAMFVDNPEEFRAEVKGRFERWVLTLMRR